MKTFIFPALLTLQYVTHSCAKLSSSSSDPSSSSSSASSPRLLSSHECADAEGWVDHFGNTCLWYHEYQDEEGQFSRCELVRNAPGAEDPANSCCVCQYRNSTTFADLSTKFEGTDNPWHIQALHTKRYLGTDAGNPFSGNYAFNDFPNVQAGFTLAHHNWAVDNDGDGVFNQTISAFSIGGGMGTYVTGGFCGSGEFITHCNAITTSYMGINPNDPTFEWFDYLDASHGHYEFESLGTTDIIAIRNLGLEMEHQEAFGVDVKYYLHDLGVDSTMQFFPETDDRHKWSPTAAFMLSEIPCPPAAFF